MQRTLLPLAVLFVCVVCSASPTYAFKRSVTKTDAPLFWDQPLIPFSLHNAGSPGLPKAATFQAMRNAIKPWTQPTCTCIRFSDRGLTTSTELGYDPENPKNNQNILIFQTKKWEHAENAVAVTSTIFQQRTGEIVAFDVEFNQTTFLFSLDGKDRLGRSTIDIANTLTHEMGHALGLDHSDVPEATMFASAPPGETKKRDLAADDTQAICTVYAQTPQGCEIARSSAALEKQGCGCQASPHTDLSFWLFPLLLFPLLLLRQR